MTAQSIYITGASSGIGTALARAVAGPDVTLGLVARRMERLEALRDELTPQGARVHVYQADVRDRERMAEVGRQFAEEADGISLAIANAGLSLNDKLLEGDPTRMNEVVSINVLGVLNTLTPLVPTMVRQGAGHMVTIGSVAGFRGMPGKAGYSGSKAAVKTIMDSWRVQLKPHGVRVTTICPGFIETELTGQNAYRMPFIMSAEKAARLTLRAVQRGRKTYVFPWQMRLVVPLLQRAPDWMLPSM